VPDLPATMTAAFLPGDSTVDFREVDVPSPGHGEVLLAVGASTICGSDIRAIYREHTGKGAEGYQGVVAGHEPAGRIVATGPGCRRFRAGDRVVVYHISGCGLCHDCRRGYMISCSSEHRRAYGWQRDGGMAPYLLAEEKDLVALPDGLSYVDGAQVACGFGTVYEALAKIGVDGTHRLLVVGLGPVGLAAMMLGRAFGASEILGVDPVTERRELARDLDLAHHVLPAGPDTVDEVLALTRGTGCERAVDCSGSGPGRVTAIRGTAARGVCAFVGEGSDVTFRPSPDLIHGDKTIVGSWVTSLWRMEQLVDRLARWGLHPEALVTDRFPLDQADDAYALMAEGKCGKVAVTFEIE